MAETHGGRGGVCDAYKSAILEGIIATGVGVAPKRRLAAIAAVAVEGVELYLMDSGGSSVLCGMRMTGEVPRSMLTALAISATVSSTPSEPVCELAMAKPPLRAWSPLALALTERGRWVGQGEGPGEHAIRLAI